MPVLSEEGDNVILTQKDMSCYDSVLLASTR